MSFTPPADSPPTLADLLRLPELLGTPQTPPPAPLVESINVQQPQNASTFSNMMVSVLANEIFRTRTSLSQQSPRPPTQQVRQPVPVRLVLPPEKKRFALFIKILLRYLGNTNNTALRLQAKDIVADCTRRSRRGELEYRPLQRAVEDRLRMAIGMEHWRRAQRCFENYCARKGLRPAGVAV